MPIKNYKTKVSESRTVGEIMQLLAAKGARSVRVDYDELNRPSAVSFIVMVCDAPIPFKLPCNFAGVEKAMSNGRRLTPSGREQTRNTAWRIIKDWIAAQMALIEAGQASLAEVFLPYAAPDNGATMFDRFLAHVSNQKALLEVNP